MKLSVEKLIQRALLMKADPEKKGSKELKDLLEFLRNNNYSTKYQKYSQINEKLVEFMSEKDEIKEKLKELEKERKELKKKEQEVQKKHSELSKEEKELRKILKTVVEYNGLEDSKPKRARKPRKTVE
jgi:hypothetical protein